MELLRRTLSVHCILVAERRGVSWRKSLDRPLAVTDRPAPLVTLDDAGQYLRTAFAGVIHDEALAATAEALMEAAESGQERSVSHATDQLESYLYAQRRIRSIKRKRSGPGGIAAELRRRLDGES